MNTGAGLDIHHRGNLTDTPFARVAAALIRDKATGAVHIRDVVGDSHAYFSGGRPLGATLSRLQNPLGRILSAAKVISQQTLDDALHQHNRSEKMLGQVLLEMQAISEHALTQALEAQSRLNFLSLFAAEAGDYEFRSGLDHPQDFTPGPISGLAALYLGVRDHARPALVSPLLSTLAFSSVKLREHPRDLFKHLPPAEQMLCQILERPCLLGTMAQRVPLPARALGAFLFALDSLGILDVAPAMDALEADSS